jgi:ribosomal protein S1
LLFAVVQETLFGAHRRNKTIEVVQKPKKKLASINVAPSIGIGLKQSTAEVKSIDFLNVNDFKPGVQFLGCILTVLDDSAVISAPNGVLAKVHLADLADELAATSTLTSLSQLIEERQILRCCVLSNTIDDKFITVSCRASVVNRGLALKHLVKGFRLYGTVKSIEDRGFLINAGVQDVNCFLPISSKFPQNLVIG